MGVVVRRPRFPILALLAAALALPVAAGVRADEGPRGGEPMYEPRFRAGAPSDSLLLGPPALARGNVHAFVDLFEAAFDLALPAEQEQALRDAIETEYEAFGEAERQAFLDLGKDLPALERAARAGERERVLSGIALFRETLSSRLERTPGRASTRVLQAAIARRSQVAWPGDPVVPGTSADAWLELCSFLLRLARNEVEGPTPGQVGALEQLLASELRARPREERLALGAAHRTWLRVKAAWDLADSATRTRMRYGALTLLAGLLPKERCPALGEGRDLATYVRDARLVAGALERYDAFGLLARNPARVLSALAESFGTKGDAPEWTFVLR